MAKSDKPTIVDGIKVDVTAESFDDFEVTECLADLVDESADDAARLAATVRIYRLVFGDDLPRVKSELRERHDGRLTNETMGAFLTSCMEAAKAKN